MSIKLVCMDLDGTINDGWNLYPALRAKMEDLRHEGVVFAIVTGRDPLGTLYFVANCGFPFDYLGTGGGGIIVKPMSHNKILNLFNAPETIESINHGRSKTGRLKRIQELVGASDEETLFCEDNPDPNSDIGEMLELKCKLGCPATNNTRWESYVREVGFVSNASCGRGTLEILNHYFGG